MTASFRRQRRSGGPIPARRILAFVAAMGIAAGADLRSPVLAADLSACPNVTVTEDRGTYSVTARFQVSQPPAVVLAVLTDYEQIPRFMPRVRTSIVLERAGDRAVVEQEAVSRVMTFSKRVHLVLEIRETADTLEFRDRCGRSFARYEGRWQVLDQKGTTEVQYELTAQPSFDVPEFLVKRVLRRDAVDTIEQLQREIAARSS